MRATADQTKRLGRLPRPKIQIYGRIQLDSFYSSSFLVSPFDVNLLDVLAGSSSFSSIVIRAVNLSRVARCSCLSLTYKPIDKPDTVMVTDHTTEMLVTKLKPKLAREVLPA